MKTVICKMQERGDVDSLSEDWASFLKLQFVTHSSQVFCASEERGIGGLVYARWRAKEKRKDVEHVRERNWEFVIIMCSSMGWQEGGSWRMGYDIKPAKGHPSPGKADQTYHPLRRPSNDSNKPNKDTMQLEERECQPESLREKQMKVKGGGLHTRNRKSNEFVRLSLLWIHTI